MRQTKGIFELRREVFFPLEEHVEDSWEVLITRKSKMPKTLQISDQFRGRVTVRYAKDRPRSAKRLSLGQKVSHCL